MSSLAFIYRRLRPSSTASASSFLFVAYTSLLLRCLSASPSLSEMSVAGDLSKGTFISAGLLFSWILIQLDAPKSSDAMYLTRPISRFRLIVTKILLLVMLISVPWALTESYLLFKIGGTEYQLLLNFLIAFFEVSVFVAFGLLVSCVTKTVFEYLAVLASATLVFFAFERYVFINKIVPVIGFMYAPDLASTQHSVYVDESLLWLALTIMTLVGFVSTILCGMRIRSALLPLIVIPPIVIVFGLERIDSTGRIKATLSDTVETEVAFESAKAILRKGDSGRKLTFALPTTMNSEGMLPHVLRFKELSIVDDNGVEHQITIQNRGMFPCVPERRLKELLLPQFGKLSLERIFECETGETYQLSDEIILEGEQIPRVRGTVVGMYIRPTIQYILTEDKPYSHLGPEAPIYASLPCLATRSCQFWLRGELFEASLYPPLSKHPMFSDGDAGTAMEYYTFTSHSNYVLVDSALRMAIPIDVLTNYTKEGASAGIVWNSVALKKTYSMSSRSRFGQLRFEKFGDRFLKIGLELGEAFEAPIDQSDMPIKPIKLVSAEDKWF